MAGVGKLLKQAKKMQAQMEAVQEDLANHLIEVSSGGGAVKIEISAAGEFKAITFDPEFLKEDKEFVEETLVAAVQEAASKAKAVSEEEMGKVTAGMQLPGLM